VLIVHKKAGDSTLQSTAEDCNNSATELPNAPGDPQKKIIQRMDLKQQLKNQNLQILN
jgi:hypothetical protein